MNGAQQQQLMLPIFDPTEPGRVMPQDDRAFFAIAWLSATGRLNQQIAFELDQIEDVLRMVQGQANVYIAQSTFDRPIRRHTYVAHATHAHVDVDAYHVAALAGLTRDELARDIRLHCDATGTPQPSAVISSGRGLYLKWYYTTPVDRAEVGSVVASNRALRRRLEPFGADPKATDATRLLRVTGTQHTKAGRMVELLHLEQRGGHAVTYDAGWLARQVAPSAAREPTAGLILPSVAEVERAARPYPGGRMFTREGWHWTVIEDVHHLARMRWGGGTVPPGWRDTFGHVIAAQLARIFGPDHLYREIVAQARLLLPAGYIERELPGHCSTLLHRAREQAPYRYRKATPIELLQVTPAEERHMKALISEAEGKRRDAVRQREQRRAAGLAERDAYEAAAAERRIMVAERRSRGMSWRAIAAELGISVGEAHRLGQP